VDNPCGPFPGGGIGEDIAVDSGVEVLSAKSYSDASSQHFLQRLRTTTKRNLKVPAGRLPSTSHDRCSLSQPAHEHQLLWVALTLHVFVPHCTWSSLCAFRSSYDNITEAAAVVIV
jgi:hypothetical protein